MSQAKRKVSLGRRIKRSLSQRFRDSPLIRLLILKAGFRVAFLGCVGFAIIMALYLPKIWRTSPQGFMPVIRISWLDMTQCWSLKRSARQAMTAGDFENAEHSWQMAVAQNPADVSAVQGYLDNFARLKHPAITMDRVVDTLALARRKHPAGPNSLDALCKRYAVDMSKRTKHGALIDCLLLANVYIELLGERQATFGLQTAGEPNSNSQGRAKFVAALPRPQPLPPRVTQEARRLHETYVQELGANAIWLKYLASAGA